MPGSRVPFLRVIGFASRTVFELTAAAAAPLPGGRLVGRLSLALFYAASPIGCAGLYMYYRKLPANPLKSLMVIYVKCVCFQTVFSHGRIAKMAYRNHFIMLGYWR